jgi:hypothetical protein
LAGGITNVPLTAANAASPNVLSIIALRPCRNLDSDLAAVHIVTPDAAKTK